MRSPPTPSAGELLPHGAEVVGVERYLATFCLSGLHEHGGRHDERFAHILGIIPSDLDHLVAEIHKGVLQTPINSVRENAPFATKCAVDIPVRGVRQKRSRTTTVRTIWEIATDGRPPRLLSAFINGPGRR